MTPDMTIGTFRQWLTPLRMAGLCLSLAAALSIMAAPHANAQLGGRVAMVAVEEAGEDVLSIFADIQGRVAAGADIVSVVTDITLNDTPEARLQEWIKATR